MTEISAHVEVDLAALERYQKSIDAQLEHKETGPVEKALKQWAWRYRSFVQLRFDTFSKGGGDWPKLATQTVARRRKKGGGTHGDTMRKIKLLQKKNRAIGKPKAGKVKKSRGKTSVTTGKKTGRKKKFKLSSLVKTVKTKIKQGKKDRAQRNKITSQIAKLQKSIKVSILRNIGLLFQALQPIFAQAPGALEGNIPFGIRVGYGGPATHPGSRLSIADIAAVHQNGLGHVPKREIIVQPPDSVLEACAKDMTRALKKLSEDVAGPDTPGASSPTP